MRGGHWCNSGPCIGGALYSDKDALVPSQHGLVVAVTNRLGQPERGYRHQCTA